MTTTAAAVATEQSDRSWHAVYTRSRHEKKVAAFLAEKDVEHFLPLKGEMSQWVDRKKWVRKPLFPGYLFVRVGPGQLPAVQHTRGVVTLVGPDPCQPSIVPDHEVNSIRRLVESDLPVDPHPHLRPGEPVRITRGPLRGAKGTLMRKSRQFLLVVSVEIIGRSVAVELPTDAVESLEVLESDEH
ncbi:MAG: UpxY family transcription antiterminator [Candidatus Brocadiaceae bacterium]|jgi:transcription antitermination factor NusG